MPFILKTKETEQYRSSVTTNKRVKNGIQAHILN